MLFLASSKVKMCDLKFNSSLQELHNESHVNELGIVKTENSSLLPDKEEDGVSMQINPQANRLGE